MKKSSKLQRVSWTTKFQKDPIPFSGRRKAFQPKVSMEMPAVGTWSLSLRARPPSSCSARCDAFPSTIYLSITTLPESLVNVFSLSQID